MQLRNGYTTVYRVHWLVIIVTLILSTHLIAHLCNNIYRTPDRLVVKPEKQSTTIKDSDQFRVFVQNNYPTFLHNVRLKASAGVQGITVTVTPQAIRVMKPGERSSFTIKVTASPNVPHGRYALTFSISAKEIGFRAVQATNAEVLRRYLRDDNFSARVLAAESLARMGDRNAIQYLVRTAMRGDRDARSRSIRALGSAGCKKQVSVLESLLRERDGWIVGNAIMALGMLRAEKAVIQQCLYIRDRFVQTCALAALAMHGEKAPLPYLKQLLNDRDNFVRAAAAWGLAAAKDKAAIETLDRLLSIDNVMLRVFIGDALVYLARSSR